jgi:hypothetical protein
MEGINYECTRRRIMKNIEEAAKMSTVCTMPVNDASALVK